LIRFITITVVSLALTLFAAFLYASDPLWIDVRTPEEYSSGHVEGAVNIPYTEISARIGEVTEDKDATIYVYCRSGRRSGIAQSELQQSGFSNVVNVGGLDDALAKAAEVVPE
jgi:phage shock protein E